MPQEIFKNQIASYSEIEFYGSFDHINLQAVQHLKYSCLFYVHYLTLQSSLLSYLYHHDLTTFLSFLLHTVEVPDALNIPINLANVVTLCLGKLKTNHMLISN